MKRFKARNVALMLSCALTAGCAMTVLPAMAAEEVQAVAEEAAPEAVAVAEEAIVAEDALPEEAQIAPAEEVISYEAAEATGDSFDTAQSLTAGKKVSMTFQSTDQKRYFAISTTQSGYVVFHLEHELLATIDDCWGISLYDLGKNPVTMNTLGGSCALPFKGNVSPEKSIAVGLPAGTYYVAVNAEYGGSDTAVKMHYTFTADANRETEANGTVADADPVKTGVFYRGACHYYDYDYYRFELPKAGYITLDIKHDADESGHPWDVAVLKEVNGELVTCGLGEVAGAGSTATIKSPAMGLDAGTYYVRFYGSSSFTMKADYSFRINYTQAGNWEKEPNNAVGNSTRVATDQKIYGTMFRYEDFDYYGFQVQEDGEISITFAYESGASVEDAQIRLVDNSSYLQTVHGKKNQTQLVIKDAVKKGRLYFVMVLPENVYTPKDTYYIKISTGKNEGGTWKQDSKGWWYKRANGTYPKNCWEKIGGKWYHFDASGYMQTGWQKISGKWYYFESSGAMVTGWKKLSGKWYYFAGGGDMVTGWKQLSGKWYYFESSGAMKTGWLKDSGKWYYLKSGGAMAVSESLTIKGKTYKFNAKGVCTNP